MDIQSGLSTTLRDMGKRICQDPYRLFFPLGVLAGAAGISHWLFYSWGWMRTYSGFFHSSVQMLVYMNCFVAGFLLTAVPRMTGSFAAQGWEIAGFLILLSGIGTFLALEQWLAAEGIYLAWLVLLVAFFIRRVKGFWRAGGPATVPRHLLWLPLAIGLGLTGTVLLMAGQAGWLGGWAQISGKPLMEQGFLLAVVIGIGGFLISRLMDADQKQQTMNPLAPGRFNTIMYLAAGILLLASFLLEGAGQLRWGYLLRAGIVAHAFIGARVLNRLPVGCRWHVVFAWLSVWCVVIGYAAAGLWPEWNVAMLHIAFLGGFSLMTFSVATMVIFSHAGQGDVLRGRVWFLWAALAGVGLALIKRLVVIFLPEQYFRFLGLAAIFWIAGSAVWLAACFPRFFTAPSGQHNAASHQITSQQKSC